MGSPTQWDRIECRVPVIDKVGREPRVKACTDRIQSRGGIVEKRVLVEGNPFSRLEVQPSLEDRDLQAAERVTELARGASRLAVWRTRSRCFSFAWIVSYLISELAPDPELKNYTSA